MLLVRVGGGPKAYSCRDDQSEVQLSPPPRISRGGASGVVLSGDQGLGKGVRNARGGWDVQLGVRSRLGWVGVPVREGGRAVGFYY